MSRQHWGNVLLTTAAPAAWGTTYAITTELLPSGHPLLAGALRSLPAGLILALVLRQRPTGWWWLKVAVLGTLNIGAFFAFLFIAASRLPGGVAAAVGACQPLVATLLSSIIFKQRPQTRTVLASIAGVGGVTLLVLRSSAALDAVGLAAAIAGALCMATGVVMTKVWGRPVGVLAFTSWQLIAGGVVLAPLAVLVEGLPDHLVTRNVVGYVWLATAGGVIAYALWFRGIALLPVTTTAMLGLMSPVVAAVVGWVVLDQSLRPLQLVGLVITLAAVVVVQLATTPTSSPSLAPPGLATKSRERAR
jgi:probable blue pigment (indigoidine) exporter